jgi:Protein of unknown function (DUF3800)
VRFAYMDEAGNTGRNLDDSNQQIHLILTVVIDESRIMLVHEHMRDTARRHFAKECLREDFEFHGQALFAGSGFFAGMSPVKRIEIYDDILRGIEIGKAEVIVRGVHKPQLKARYTNPFHPHDISLMFTIEEIERMAKVDGCRVLLVADEAREIEDTALRDLASYQEIGTSWGFNTEQIDNIVDTIHFVPSQTNPAIQLADCATFIAARKRKIDAGLVSTNSAVKSLWSDRIDPFVRLNAVWYPTP